MTTIGFIGSGELARRMTISLLDDLKESLGKKESLTFIVPITKGQYNDQIEDVIEWAVKNDVDFEVIADSTTDKVKTADDYVEMATAVHEIGEDETVPGLLVDAFTGVPDSRLFVFWGEDADDDSYDAFEAAWDAGIEAFDLCNGLERLTFDDDEEPTEIEEKAKEGLVSKEEVEAQIEEGADEHQPEQHNDEPRNEIDQRAELARKTAAELKAICADKDIFITRNGKGRIKKEAYADAILKFEETGHDAFFQDDEKGGVYEIERPTADETVDVPRDVDKTTGEIEADPEAPADTDVEVPEDSPVDEVPDTPEEDLDLKVESVPEQGTPTSSSSEGYTTVKYTNATTVQSSQYPLQAGSCVGCGGPVFTLSEGDVWPDVKWYHADKCPLA